MTDKGYSVKDWDLPMASEITDDKCVFEVLQTFGLSQEDLHSLSQHSAEELTVENLPGILQAYMKKKLAHTQKSSADQSTHSTPPASLPTSVQGKQIRKYRSPSPPSILHSRSGHTLKGRLDPSALSQPVSRSEPQRVQKEWGHRSHSSPSVDYEKLPCENNRSPRRSPSLSAVSRFTALQVEKAREPYRSRSPSPLPVIRSTFEHINTSGTGRPSSQPSAFVLHSDMGASSLAHMVDNSSEDAQVVDYDHGFSSKERVKETKFTFSDATKVKLDQFGQTYKRKSPVEKPKRLNYTQGIAAPLQHHAKKIRVVQSRHQEAQKDIVESQPSRHQTEDFSSCSGTKRIQPQSESSEKLKKPQRRQGVDLNQRIDVLRLFLLNKQKRQHSKNIQNEGQQIEGPSVENFEPKQIQNIAIELKPLQQEQMPLVNITHQSMQGSHGFQQHVPICAPPVFESIPPQPVFESIPPQHFGNIAPPQTNIISGYVGLSQPNPPIHGHLGGDNVYPPFLGYAGPPPPIPPVIVDPSILNIAPPPFPVYVKPPQVNLPMPATLGFNNVPPYFHGNPSPSPSWPPMFPLPQTTNNVYPTFPGTAGPPQTNPVMPPLPGRYPPHVYSVENTPGTMVNLQSTKKNNNQYSNLRILTNVSHRLNAYQSKPSSTSETVQGKLETPSVCEAKKTEPSAVPHGNEVDNKTSDDIPFQQRSYPLLEEMQNYNGDYRHNETFKCFLCSCTFNNQTELDNHLKDRSHKMNIQIFSIQFRVELNNMNYFRCDIDNKTKSTNAVPEDQSADGVKPDLCKHRKDANPATNVNPPSSVQPVVQHKSVTDNTKPVDRQSTDIVTTAAVAKQASGVPVAAPVSFTETNISKAVPAAIENPSFLQRDHPTKEEISNYNGFFPKTNDVYKCHFCTTVCNSPQEMLIHRNKLQHLGLRNAFSKRFAKELLCMRKGICPQNVVAATIKSAEAAKIKTSQPDALPAKDAAPVPTEGGNILQPEGPATASMESVQTADVKTSDTDTLGAKSLKSAGTPGVDSLPANCEPSPSLARGTSPSEKATQGTCFQKNTLLISPFSGGSDTATTSKTAPVGTPSKPSDVEPQLVVKTVAGAESRDRHPGKVVIVKPRHATSRAPGDGHAGDRGDARVTTTSASTNKEGDDDVLGGEMKTAEEVERQRSHGCLTRESAVHSLQKGPTAKALGETSNDALAPKENKLMMKRDSIRGAARGEKRGDAEQGKNEKPVSKKAKIQAKDTPPPLNRDPIGVEFMLSGFYCKLCSSFFSKEDFVRKHCHKHQHQQNLQKKETR
uniref:Uncharacterized protein LOC116939004 isoform X1 n=1 Tax=Petromyzon marinus TaxID=7757 RepID=A0AAJ7SQD7_PETMA|nr:uncharacterized protein LOC116939004 isoform X1 [Petromyzon marinus]XP_032802727.1 uncharacterized protein LOC116939004 isoform X1 [Petromyzon marinus]XP_032802728.1 uncharacterized protein LOC116939004 isoform X1 [Petromyzon marinus]